MALTHGYNSDILINGAVSLCASKWSVNTKVDEIDVSNFCDPGYAAWLGGPADADITIEGVLGSAAGESPTTVLLLRTLGDLRIGSLASINIYPDVGLSAAASWSFPTALVCSWNMESSPRDAVRWTLTAKANGPWTEPNL